MFKSSGLAPTYLTSPWCWPSNPSVSSVSHLNVNESSLCSALLSPPCCLGSSPFFSAAFLPLHSSKCCLSHTSALKQLLLSFSQLTAVVRLPPLVLWPCSWWNALLKLCFTSCKLLSLFVHALSCLYSLKKHTPTMCVCVLAFLQMKGELPGSLVTSSLWDACPYMALRP